MEIVSASVAIMRADGNFQWDDAYPVSADFEADIAAGSLYVEELDGAVRGVICVDQNQPPEYVELTWRRSPPVMVVHRFAISPRHRRQGVGGRLLGFAIERARAAGCSSLRTDTNAKNPAMRALFSALGLVPVGEFMFSDHADPYVGYEILV